jgi:integrase/recombinase XerD
MSLSLSKTGSKPGLIELGVPQRAAWMVAFLLPFIVGAWLPFLAVIIGLIFLIRLGAARVATSNAFGSADTAYVSAPAVPRDGKTVGLTPEECRLLLDAPASKTPEGIRDRSLLGVLAFTGCRVGEVCRLRVQDYKSSGGHKILEVRGKGGKERRVPLHIEAVERLDEWIAVAKLQETGALFRPVKTARGRGKKGFLDQALTRRAVQYLVSRYVKRLGLDTNITVHSFRVTALTTARERGADIIDLQDFAGHADPRTTLAYIRNRDRLSRSPAYVLKY